ncbi:MAG: FAD:protein transferase [Glaciihabitans sp.]|nr:FAD:protein transferase [Glaciihabitans sp.]
MPRAELRFEAIGAPWQIDAPDPLPPTLVDAIHARIDEYDRTWSRFRSDSLVARVATEPGTWAFPSDAPPLFDLYRALYDASGGTATPLVGRRLENLGYDADYSLRPAPTRVEVPAWDDVMSWDGSTLTTRVPVVLDVGAAGKGYLVDIVAAMIRDAGIEDYTVDGSGDLVHAGGEPLRIALEHPFDPTLAIGIYELSDGALCASAPGRRAWGTGLHHILDGLTGEPTTDVAATWAMASSGLVADGLATALFFVDGDTLATALPPGPEYEFEYVRMFPTSRVEHSPGFRGELFT